MFRKHTVAAKGRPTKRDHVPRIQKSRDAVRPTKTESTRKSNRLSNKTLKAQVEKSLLPLEYHSISQEPVQQSSTLSTNQTLTGRKRKHESDSESLSKLRANGSRAVVESVHELSQRNLEEYNRQAKSETFMGRGKRALSRRTSTADLSQDTASICSQRSSTNTNYRWTNLESARIFVENEPIPKNIQIRVNAIIQPTLSEQKDKELSALTNNICNDFVDVMKEPSREDDSIEPIHAVLTALDSSKKFLFPRKSDWDETLKPIIPRSIIQFNLADKPTNTADDFPGWPNKRKQLASPYVSPEQSQFAMPPSSLSSDVSWSPMPPPPAPPKENMCNVKTPRPDITVGFRDAAIIEKLKAKGLYALQANGFFNALQDQRGLCSNPLLPAYHMRFPPLVIEGKSYSTGRPIFEAQNQAAVSGSCMTNLQHKLTEMTTRIIPGYQQSMEPLAFSICTEGPMMQLWVHYTALMDGERMYHMNILRICHASTQPFLQEGVKDFFKAVYGVMEWAKSELLDRLVEQLESVWKASRWQHDIVETG